MTPTIALDLAAKVAASLARDPYIKVTEADKDAVEDIVTQKVAPVLEHLTNTEAWWRSRVTLGALLGGVSGLLALFGIVFDLETQMKIINLILAAGPVVGMLITVYGRWKAKKPLWTV